MEYAGVRGLEQRMYREQEAIKSKTHKDVHQSYINLCSKLTAYNTVFFPVKVGWLHMLLFVKERASRYGFDSEAYFIHECSFFGLKYLIGSLGYYLESQSESFVVFIFY